jgi:hypothetical protein
MNARSADSFFCTAVLEVSRETISLAKSTTNDKSRILNHSSFLFELEVVRSPPRLALITRGAYPVLSLFGVSKPTLPR